jgi:hypothetical protein
MLRAHQQVCERVCARWRDVCTVENKNRAFRKKIQAAPAISHAAHLLMK